MKALKISKNGKEIAIAGIDCYSVVTAIVTNHNIDPNSKTGQAMIEEGCFEKEQEKTDIAVGGLNSLNGENIEWAQENLVIGDTITVEIIELK